MPIAHKDVRHLGCSDDNAQVVHYRSVFCPKLVMAIHVDIYHHDRLAFPAFDNHPRHMPRNDFVRITSLITKVQNVRHGDRMNTQGGSNIGHNATRLTIAIGDVGGRALRPPPGADTVLVLVGPIHQATFGIPELLIIVSQFLVHHDVGTGRREEGEDSVSTIHVGSDNGERATESVPNTPGPSRPFGTVPIRQADFAVHIHQDVHHIHGQQKRAGDRFRAESQTGLVPVHRVTATFRKDKRANVTIPSTVSDLTDGPSAHESAMFTAIPIVNADAHTYE